MTRGFLVLAALAAAQLLDAVRIVDEDVTEQSGRVARAGRESCTREVVEDAVRCGVDRVLESIEDGLRCGFDWCDTPPLYLCPKSCDVLVDRPRRCEILLSCEIAMTLHLRGQTSTSSIANISFIAELLDFELTQDSEELQEAIDGNKQRLMPMMQENLDIGVPIANQLLREEIVFFEEEVIKLLELDIVSSNAWIARLILGGKGFQEGAQRAIDARFRQIGADVHKRFQVEAFEENSTRDRLCHRLLRVRTESGAEFHISDWENALVARSVDLTTQCHTAYTAHCNTGSFVATTECPLKAPVVTRKCLFNTWCWSSRRVIQAAQQKVTTLFRGNDEVVTIQKVTIDHIEAPDEDTGVPSSYAYSMPAVRAKQVSPSNAQRSELDALVQIRDDELGGTMRDEVCKELRANAFWGMGAITEARCRLVFATIYRYLQVTVPIPLGEMSIPADISFTGGSFRTEFIPDWDILSEVANNAVKAQIDAVTLPLDARVESLNIRLSGDNDTIYVEASPTLTGVLNEEKIRELYDLLSGLSR